MMTRFTMAIAAVLSICGSAYAQVGGVSISPGPPLGFTSPLGLGPGSPVGPSKIPMGATELASPAVSPLISGTSPMSPAASATCGASSPGTSAGTGSSSTTGASGTATALFDGGG